MVLVEPPEPPKVGEGQIVFRQGLYVVIDDDDTWTIVKDRRKPHLETRQRGGCFLVLPSVDSRRDPYRDFTRHFIDKLIVGDIEKHTRDDLALLALEQSSQSAVNGVEPDIERVGKCRSRATFRKPTTEQPRIIGFESQLPVDGDADQRLLVDPEAVVDRDMEPRTGPSSPTVRR